MKYLLLLSLFFVGCVSSFKTPTRHRILSVQPGMTEREVFVTMRDFDYEVKTQTGYALIWSDREVPNGVQDFIIHFDKSRVVTKTETGLVDKSERSSSGANAMAAFGQALSNTGQQNQTNCVSRTDPFGNVRTQCNGN